MKLIISLVFLSLLPQWLLAQDIPDFSANYLVKLNGLQAGELKRSLVTHSSGTRHFSSATHAKGVFAFFKPDLVEESSTFQSNGSSIIPLSYLYQRTGGKKEKYLHLDFDWQNQRVHIDDRKQPWKLNIHENTLDKLVYQLALMADLGKGETQFSYQIADGGKLKTYNIEMLDSEIISTPLGQIKAVKLIRLRDKSSKRQSILWCAPELNYLPIKLEHTEKGGARFTAIIRRLKGFDTQSAFTKPAPKIPQIDIK